MLRAVTGATWVRRSTAKALMSLRLISSSRCLPNRGRMWTRSIDSYLASVAGPAVWAGSQRSTHSRRVGAGLPDRCRLRRWRAAVSCASRAAAASCVGYTESVTILPLQRRRTRKPPLTCSIQPTTITSAVVSLTMTATQSPCIGDAIGHGGEGLQPGAWRPGRARPAGWLARWRVSEVPRDLVNSGERRQRRRGSCGPVL
jgi:hypothetical protein